MSIRLPRLAIAAALGLAAALQVGASAPSEEALAARLASSSRAEADKLRDAGRKPAAVVTFLGIRPGMTVLDLIAAGGYYTEVLSLAVGPEGRVYAQNTEFALKIRDGANDKAMRERLAGGRLANVVRLDREFDALDLEPGSIDAAVTALNFHDIWNSGGQEAADGFLRAVHRALAPGGVLGIIDHSGGSEGADDRDLHRIEEAIVIEAALRAGFEVEATSDVLRNPDDDRTQNVFAPGLRGATDRFVLKLRKPAS